VSSKQKKLLFFVIWLMIVLWAPLTILKTARIEKQNPASFFHLLQRSLGLLAFPLLFIQIILGAFMKKWKKVFGRWIFKFHQIQGGVIYSLIFLHAIAYLFFYFKLTGKFDPFYVFTDVCFLCKKNEFFITFGRLSFWLVCLTIFAALMRAEEWWKKNWRQLHALNYLVFFLVVAHSWVIGSDVKVKPFLYFYWLVIIFVLASLFIKYLYPRVIRKG
jgi:DMSO/TMAO reductase YedYZ heme-binding membrane subunit